MTVFVDGDNCDKEARKIILKSCKRNSIDVKIVANRNIPIATENVSFTMIVCDSSKDSADTYIVENSSGDDVAVTKDLILAKRLIDKKIVVLNDMGRIFTAENIEELLEQRKLSLQMKSLGISNGAGFRSAGKKSIGEFSSSFNSLIDQKSNSSN